MMSECFKQVKKRRGCKSKLAAPITTKGGWRDVLTEDVNTLISISTNTNIARTFYKTYEKNLFQSQFTGLKLKCGQKKTRLQNCVAAQITTKGGWRDVLTEDVNTAISISTLTNITSVNQPDNCIFQL